jgi:hypothetical protein
VSIDTQLQDAARALIESVEHFEPDLGTAVARRRSGRRRLVIVGACAAFVLVAGVGLTAALRGNDITDDPIVAPTTTGLATTAPTTGAASPPATSPTTVEAVWSLIVDSPRSVAETRATALGFVTAGFNGIWTSDDGVSWTLSAAVPSAIQCEPSGFAEFGYGVVVAGCGSELDGWIDLLVWMGSDTMDWRQVTVDRFPTPYTPGPSVVAATSDKVVIAVDTTGNVRFDQHGTELWISADGINWIRHSPAETGLTDVAIVDIAAVEGRLVAIAETRNGDDLTIDLLVSEDGVEWSAPDVPHSRGRLVEVSGGLVLLDGSETWSTTDGLTWDPWITAPAELVGLQVTDAAPMDDGLVIVGLRWERPDATGAVDTEIWRASPVAGWSRIPDPNGLMDDSYAWHVAATDEIVVVVGEIPDSGSSDPTDRLERIRTWVWSTV